MSIKLSSDEIEEFLTNGHTLILSTIRQSGEPFATPIWYVYDHGSFYISTPEKSAKARHLKRDPRACCTVEAGKYWKELRAIIANCDAQFVEDEAEIQRIRKLMDEKYANFQPASANMPKSAKKAYSTKFAFIRLTPREDEIRSWDNRKIRST